MTKKNQTGRIALRHLRFSDDPHIPLTTSEYYEDTNRLEELIKPLPDSPDLKATPAEETAITGDFAAYTQKDNETVFIFGNTKYEPGKDMANPFFNITYSDGELNKNAFVSNLEEIEQQDRNLHATARQRDIINSALASGQANEYRLSDLVTDERRRMVVDPTKLDGLSNTQVAFLKQIYGGEQGYKAAMRILAENRDMLNISFADYNLKVNPLKEENEMIIRYVTLSRTHNETEIDLTGNNIGTGNLYIGKPLIYKAE